MSHSITPRHLAFIRDNEVTRGEGAQKTVGRGNSASRTNSSRAERRPPGGWAVTGARRARDPPGTAATSRPAAPRPQAPLPPRCSSLTPRNGVCGALFDASPCPRGLYRKALMGPYKGDPEDGCTAGGLGRGPQLRAQVLRQLCRNQFWLMAALQRKKISLKLKNKVFCKYPIVTLKL